MRRHCRRREKNDCRSCRVSREVGDIVGAVSGDCRRRARGEGVRRYCEREERGAILLSETERDRGGD